MEREKEKRIVRAIPSKFETRDEADGRKVIEGYFAVFDSNYEIFSDMSESIDRHAFDNTIGGDIRALINHDTTLVLGRTTAHTLELRIDEHGLWGHIDINPNDGDAMNLYARVQRGDVSQCSIGFDIVREETEFRPDGGIHWTIKELDLWEVSCCTFPAYTETNISARAKDRDDVRARKMKAWQAKMKERAEKWH